MRAVLVDQLLLEVAIESHRRVCRLERDTGRVHLSVVEIEAPRRGFLSAEVAALHQELVAALVVLRDSRALEFEHGQDLQARSSPREVEKPFGPQTRLALSGQWQEERETDWEERAHLQKWIGAEALRAERRDHSIKG